MIFWDNKDFASDRGQLPYPVLAALNWIKETDFSKLEPGRYPIGKDDGAMFCLYQQYDTVDVHEKRSESHKEYIDLQYIISGEESIGFARAGNGEVVDEDLTPDSDMVWYSSVPNGVLYPLKTGEFMVLFPNDIHRPGLNTNGVSSVTKAMVKIHKNLF
ncbi:YhcH/YjgK/YiaL family protein [Herbiconiux daphne]|uniref:YhcH/YjgK/YiaL family protein n=1 Tax=Herbiconiux daphne TaxID=2970914 RepID=A0ABT2HAM8_9MICO|nr:YhcH/YjgK/YiaL family protein [Herbiconiux daphne]MCS5736987.1 YhcH/YjgK/YiaL family protein [Herbiconiux daphne]